MAPPIKNPYSRKSAATTANTTITGSNAATTTASTAANHQSMRLSSSNTTNNAAFVNSQRQQRPTADTFSQAFDVYHHDPVEQIQTGASTNQHNALSTTSPSSNLNSTNRVSPTKQGLQQQQENSLFSTDRDFHVLLEQPHVLYVSTKQRGNGILDYIRNVPIAFSRMVPDYILSATRCALFLSLKYHSLYNDYIGRRVAELRTDFTLRILLVLVDVADNANLLLYLNKFAVTHNLTLILAWTEEEAARYLETYKVLDGKDASLIQKRESNNFMEQASDVLLTVKGVNQTDCGQLLTHFASLRAVVAASKEEIALIPGMGPIKVQRLYDTWHQPFSKKAARSRKKQKDTANRNAKKSDTTNDNNEPTSGTSNTVNKTPIEVLDNETTIEILDNEATIEILDDERTSDIQEQTK